MTSVATAAAIEAAGAAVAAARFDQSCPKEYFSQHLPPCVRCATYA